MRKPFMISLVAGIVIGFLVMVQDGFREYPDLQTGRLVIGAIGAILGFGLTALRYKGKKPKSPQDS